MILSSLIFSSCNNEADENISTSNSELLKREVSNPTILSFEADVKATKLALEMSNWKDAVDRGDFRKEVEHRNAINTIFNALYSQYGQVNVVQYVQILKDEENVEAGTFGTHDGSACTRNLNGSLYTGACSFWEKVQFFFSLACSGMPKDTQAQINSYFNCVQADICDICG